MTRRAAPPRATPLGRDPAAVRLAIGAVAVVLLAACGGITDPSLPREASRFTPPPIYARWWSMVEACSGRSGDMGRIAWHYTPRGTPLRSAKNGEFIQGYYSRAGHRIVLDGEWLAVGSTVRHEMLHALLGVDGHPRDAFLGRCGGVVVCDRTCMEDAGPGPEVDRALPRVVPSALELSIAIDPPTPDAAFESGLFSFVVRVRNPFPHAVVVVLPAASPFDVPTTFQLQVVRDGLPFAERGLLSDPSQAMFAAGETRQHVFDLVVGSAVPSARPLALRGGFHEFRGGFGDHWASVRPVLLR